jgi:glyoxylase-like metal-dependent hydrolase (beta-lactamase superfamily II)
MPKISIIDGGTLKLDGGAMFGVVPKSLWSKQIDCDEYNMCLWSMRLLLVEDGARKILIDTGIGMKQDEKFRSHFSPSNINDFTTDLNANGIKKEDITDVFLTHLHFDHCGGVLSLDEKGGIIPTFPNAKIWSNDFHYQWAIDPNPREKASFLKENILPLNDFGILELLPVEQGLKFSDSITIDFVYGHTGGMMIPTISLDNGQRLIYCADLLPSRHHLGSPYVMSYDTQPLISIKEKENLLEKANDDFVHLFLEHDFDEAIIQVKKNEKGKFNWVRSQLIE